MYSINYSSLSKIVMINKTFMYSLVSSALNMYKVSINFKGVIMRLLLYL